MYECDKGRALLVSEFYVLILVTWKIFFISLSIRLLDWLNLNELIMLGQITSVFSVIGPINEANTDGVGSIIKRLSNIILNLFFRINSP